jgi:hypothetical protein
MGTRGLTMVIEGEKTKIAQYGQWDHYPSGQGVTILDFLSKCDLEKFKQKVKALRWLTAKEIEKVNADPNWVENYPHLSRDAGGGILEMVYKKKITGLNNNEEFAADGLYCEWAYVIDLDKRTLEVYEGFQKMPVNQKERFAKYNKKADGGYYPCRLKKKFSLDKLPTKEAFLKAFGKKA